MPAEWQRMTLALLPLALGVTIAAGASSGALPDQPAGKHVCLSPAETREIVAARKLSAPFAVLRTAGTHAHGETIGVHLCRLNEELMYEVTVLRRDGRVVKVVLDAASGKIVRTLNDR